jgi:hypothetical protein
MLDRKSAFDFSSCSTRNARSASFIAPFSAARIGIAATTQTAIIFFMDCPPRMKMSVAFPLVV